MNGLGTAMRYSRWKPLIYLIPFEWRNCRKQRKQDLIFKEAILFFFHLPEFTKLFKKIRKLVSINNKKINTKITINLHCAGFANLITLSSFVLLHQLPTVFFQLLTPHNEELL